MVEVGFNAEVDVGVGSGGAVNSCVGVETGVEVCVGVDPESLQAANITETRSRTAVATAARGLRWTPKFGQVAKRESRS